MRVLRVDVQAEIVLVAHAVVEGWIFERLALEKGFDRTLELTALFHPAPLLLKRLVKKQLNRWGAIDTRLFCNLLIGFDINFDALRSSIQFG